MYRKTFIEINLDYLSENVRNLVKSYNKYKYYFGVVKGSCYGHGEYCVNTLIEAGINYLAVSTLEEAIKIREYNKTIPILCLQPINVEFLNICLKNNITITIHDYDYFKDLMSIGLDGTLKVHLKIDSGMNRLGIKNEEEVVYIYNTLMENSHFYLEGIYTHFGTPGIFDKSYDNQVDNFIRLTSLIDLSKIDIIHLDRSVTMLAHKKLDFSNGVRLGIIMYGYNQLHKPVLNTFRQKLRYFKKKLKNMRLNVSKTNIECTVDLKPAYKFVSEIIQVKKIFKGEHVGYGEIYTAPCDGYIATISVGYADGFSLENYGRDIIINNKRYKIVGAVSMGMIMVNVDSSVHIGDLATLIGDKIELIEVSVHNHSTQYETLCRANSRVPRIYIKDNKIVCIKE